jgi:hypothetical protein
VPRWPVSFPPFRISAFKLSAFQFLVDGVLGVLAVENRVHLSLCPLCLGGQFHSRLSVFQLLSFQRFSFLVDGVLGVLAVENRVHLSLCPLCLGGQFHSRLSVFQLLSFQRFSFWLMASLASWRLKTGFIYLCALCASVANFIPAFPYFSF